MIDKKKLLDRRIDLSKEKMLCKEEIEKIPDLRHKLNSICIKALVGSIVMTIPLCLYLVSILPKAMPLNLLFGLAGLGSIGAFVSGASLVLSNLYFCTSKSILNGYSKSLEKRINDISRKIREFNGKRRNNVAGRNNYKTNIRNTSSSRNIRTTTSSNNNGLRNVKTSSNSKTKDNNTKNSKPLYSYTGKNNSEEFPNFEIKGGKLYINGKEYTEDEKRKVRRK